MPHQTERYRRELRRYKLALQMIAHNARTQTIQSWTGWSRSRVREAFRSYWHKRDVSGCIRHSGPPPSTLKRFWQSRNMHREAVAIAGLCHHLRALPAQSAAIDPKRLPDVERGERFCLAYNTYLSFVATPRISFEQAMVLFKALATGTEIALGRCPACQTLVLMDRLGGGKIRCAYCRS